MNGRGRTKQQVMAALAEARQRITELEQEKAQRERTERALRQSEERFKLAMEASKDGLWDWRVTTDEVYYSPGYATMLGYQPGEFPLTVDFWTEHLHPEDREAAIEANRACIDNRCDNFEVEFRMRTKDGEWRWILGRGQAVARDQNGRATRMIGTHTDITDRKLAEEALRESQVFLDSVFKSIQDGISILDLDLTIRHVNEVMGKWYAQTLPLEGKRCYRCYRGRSEPCEPCPTLAAIASGKTEWTIVPGLPGAEVEWLELFSYPIKDPDTGQITGVVEFVRDITERMALEEQLRHQERLAAVGQLAGGIAHDFRNLLAVIILYAQMDRGKPGLPPRVAEHLDVIIQESQRATDLVQQILDFTSQSMIRREALDLVDFVTDVVDRILRRTIPEAIALNVEVRPVGGVDTFIVHADPGRIQQALTNLALNARDAMPEGGELRFIVSGDWAFPEDLPSPVEMQPETFVCLTVADTGIGMTAEVKDHLFEPFFTTKEVGQGTGLGLAQVFGIVRQHEGAIDVETAVGEGTKFHVYLPRAEDPDCEAPGEPGDQVPKGRGETILFVEDDRRIRQAVKDGLDALNYRVLTAANGREALRRVSLSEVDLVLTDMVMPEMGGRALLRALQTRAPDLCVIALTGYVMEMDVDALLDAGFRAVISKPFAIEDLVTLVRDTLDDPQLTTG